MTPTVPESPLRRRNEQIIGVLLAVLGLVVLVVAIIALRHPKGHQATAAPLTSSSAAAASSAATSPHHTASTSSRAPTSPAPTTRPSNPAATSTSPSTTTSASTSTTASTGSTTSAVALKLPLVVLNNTDVTGLAESARTRFVDGGWTVTSIGNLVNDIISTCAYYDPNVAGAQAAAGALQSQFPAIKRTAPKFDGLPAGPVVVVLTPDYAA